jgi:hypothetical protein
MVPGPFVIVASKMMPSRHEEATSYKVCHLVTALTDGEMDTQCGQFHRI